YQLPLPSWERDAHPLNTGASLSLSHQGKGCCPSASSKLAAVNFFLQITRIKSRVLEHNLAQNLSHTFPVSISRRALSAWPGHSCTRGRAGHAVIPRVSHAPQQVGYRAVRKRRAAADASAVVFYSRRCRPDAVPGDVIGAWLGYPGLVGAGYLDRPRGLRHADPALAQPTCGACYCILVPTFVRVR